MSRKIKINTVNTTDLENTLNKNLCRKPVTISGPEKTIVVSDDTHRSEEEFKAHLEQEREERKEIKKTINDSKKIVEKIRDAKVNNNVPDILKGPITINTGDANADTKIELDTYDYYVMTEEYINKVIFPFLEKVDKEKTDNIDSNVLSDFQSILVSLFIDYNIKSYKESLLNEKLMHEIEANLISFNFKENLVDHEHLVKFLSERTPGTFCQQLLKRYPNLKEKTSSILANIDNNPLEENKQNRISVTTDNDKNFIQNSKKYVEEHIIPRKKELERIEEATRNIQDLSIPVTEHYEEVNHPDHYNVYDVEVVEMMERIFGIEETMSWCKLNAFKYRMRAGEKPTSTVEKDLKKEKWCLNKYKELKSKK